MVKLANSVIASTAVAQRLPGAVVLPPEPDKVKLADALTRFYNS
jgi:hypothetical protein